MQLSWHKMMFVGLLTFVTVGCGSPATPVAPKVTVSGAGGTEPVAILRQSAGSDEAFAKIGGHLLNAAGDSKATLGDLAPNYETESVIVVALGEVPTGGFGVKITGVQKKGDDIFVQFTTSEPTGAATQVISYPFAAVAVPKTTGKLFLEEAN